MRPDLVGIPACWAPMEGEGGSLVSPETRVFSWMKNNQEDGHMWTVFKGIL